jgi:hypothetical protein
MRKGERYGAGSGSGQHCFTQKTFLTVNPLPDGPGSNLTKGVQSLSAQRIKALKKHYSTFPQDKEAESKPQRVTKKEQSDKEENEEVGRPRN